MTKKKEQPAQTFHWFASSLLNWSTHEDLLKCLERQKRLDRSGNNKMAACNVFKVPLPADATYEIEWYQPQVDGTQFIATITY